MRGGKRVGAGRPHNSGKYGEPSIPMRVPVGLVTTVQAMVEQYMHNKVARATSAPYRVVTTANELANELKEAALCLET